MKKIITLTLFLILIVFCMITSYAENNDLLMPVSDISVPVGGLSPYIQAEITDDDSFVSLDGIETSAEFEKFFYDALYEQQQTINIYNYRIPYAGFQDWYVEFAFKHPELFLVDGGYSCSTSTGYVYEISPAYYVNKSNREAFITTMNQKLDEYYNLVKDVDDELKKYLLIHSKMIREAHYDYSYLSNPKAHTVYSFFTTGGTTCQGYANALKLIGDKVGLEVAYCFNRSSDVGHIWNYIKINDKWYHTDVTWDDYNASLTDGTHNTENDQGAFHIYFLCSENTFSLNSHGNIYDFKTFGDKKTCNDTTYEDDKWAFNLNNAGAPYLTDFDCNDENIFFDLVGAKDSNGNPLKFVTNNLWGNDAYIAEPLVASSSVKYYVFSEKAIPSAKMRLVMKSDSKIKSIISNNLTNGPEFEYFSFTIPVDGDTLSQCDQVSLHMWNGLLPLAEKNVFTVSQETITE